MGIYRRTVLERSLKLILMFQAGKKLTCKDVATALGVKRHAAQNYIDATSAVLPICECGTREGNRGPAAVVYEVMK